MADPHPVEAIQSPEKTKAADRVTETAENKSRGEADTSKDSFYENIVLKQRALMQARHDGLRTGTHENFGTPTIEGSEGTRIKGGAPSKATLTDEQLKERMKDEAANPNDPEKAIEPKLAPELDLLAQELAHKSGDNKGAAQSQLADPQLEQIASYLAQQSPQENPVLVAYGNDTASDTVPTPGQVYNQVQQQEKIPGIGWTPLENPSKPDEVIAQDFSGLQKWGSDRVHDAERLAWPHRGKEDSFLDYRACRDAF